MNDKNEDKDIRMLHIKCHFALLILMGAFLTIVEAIAVYNGIDGMFFSGYVGSICLLAGVITKSLFDKLVR